MIRACGVSRAQQDRLPGRADARKQVGYGFIRRINGPWRGDTGGVPLKTMISLRTGEAR